MDGFVTINLKTWDIYSKLTYSVAWIEEWLTEEAEYSDKLQQ